MRTLTTYLSRRRPNSTILELTNTTNSNLTTSQILTDFEESFYQKHFWIYYYSNQVYLFICIYFLASTICLTIVYFNYMKLIDVKPKLEKFCSCLLPRRKERTVSINMAGGQGSPKITIRDAMAAWSNESNVLQYPKAYLYLLWAMFTIIVPLAFSNTIMFAANNLVRNEFFSSIYDPSTKSAAEHQNQLLTLLLSINTNIVGSLLIALESAISLIPVRIYHFFWPISYVAFYLLILFMCWLFDRSSFDLVYGDLIGYHLSYQYYWQMILMFIGFILVLHLIHALIYRAKIWLFYDLLKLKNLAPLNFSF